MVGWADVPDSDRDDFERWRAVDISSLLLVGLLEMDYMDLDVFSCPQKVC